MNLYRCPNCRVVYDRTPAMVRSPMVCGACSATSVRMLEPLAPEAPAQPSDALRLHQIRPEERQRIQAGIESAMRSQLRSWQFMYGGDFRAMANIVADALIDGQPDRVGPAIRQVRQARAEMAGVIIPMAKDGFKGAILVNALGNAVDTLLQLLDGEDR